MSRVNTSLTRQNNLTIFSFEHRDINGLSVDWKNGQEWITKGVLIDNWYMFTIESNSCPCIGCIRWSEKEFTSISFSVN